MPPGQPTPSQIPPLPCHHRCREPPMLSCHSLYCQKLSPLHRAAKAYLTGGPPLLHRHHCKPQQPPSSHSLSCRRVVATTALSLQDMTSAELPSKPILSGIRRLHAIDTGLTPPSMNRARGMLNSEGLISSTQISLYLITLLRDSKALHMFFFRGLVGGI